MTRVKLLIIVTNERERRRLMAAWSPFIVGQSMSAREGQAAPADEVGSPVGFARVNVRDGLSLYLFIADGGWRREYLCRVLAQHVSAYCLVVGPDADDLALGQDLTALLAEAALPPALVAATRPQDEALLRTTLDVPPGTPTTSVDCGSRAGVNELVCGLLEHLIAVPAA